MEVNDTYDDPTVEDIVPEEGNYVPPPVVEEDPYDNPVDPDDKPGFDGDSDGKSDGGGDKH
ncbi:MAG: hypothetical protein P8M80_00510 [Pirellulaceae bacterium]|nr:hypothetical protein [Pirellulaceae bacterium]